MRVDDEFPRDAHPGDGGGADDGEPAYDAVEPPKTPGRERRKKKLDTGVLQRLFRDYRYQWHSNIAWDVARREAVVVANLKHTYGNDAVRLWMGSEKRLCVMTEDVVFDPGRKDNSGVVNLFGGFAYQPKPGNVEPLLELIRHLCGGEATQYEWILDWCAWPIQNPGAKMPTSVIMHGDEGSGKNLFWECISALYGEHGKVVGQDQLEDKFNDWLSKTCFVIGDEVLSRQEMRHLKGKLKALISGKTVQINTKMMPVRQEANHVNIVFLSNELQPNALDASDRRNLVVWTPPKRERAFYQAVSDWMADGGRAHLMHFLKTRDLNAFDPHAPPPMTKAKEALIDLSRPGPERFYIAWKAGELPVKYHSCSAGQVYEAYRKWCVENGERFTAAQNWFSREVLRLAGDALSVRMMRDFDTVHRMWLVTPPPEDADALWAADAIAAFNEGLKVWK